MEPTRRPLAVGLAVAAAIIGGAYGAKQLTEGGASTAECGGIAFGWKGSVTGVRIPGGHTGVENAVIRLINEFRDQHGLRALTLGPNLRYAARYHSDDMKRRGYFDHERPGETFTARFARYTANTCIAENIAWGTSGFGKAAGIVSLWRSSPGHRHVMLLPWVRRVGVGVVVGTFDGQKQAVITTADFSG